MCFTASDDISTLDDVSINILNFLKHSECGKTFAVNNLRIVGGSTAIPNSWPSMAYVKFNYKATFLSPQGVKLTYTFSSSCGGTLITRNKVLTAAHCIPSSVIYNYNGHDYEGTVKPNSFYPTMESMFTIYLGLQDKTTIINNVVPPPAVVAKASKVVRVCCFYHYFYSEIFFAYTFHFKPQKHAFFNEKTYINDIALIYLTNDVTLSNSIQLACLPSNKSSTYPGTNKFAYAAGWGTLSYEGCLVIECIHMLRLHFHFSIVFLTQGQLLVN